MKIVSRMTALTIALGWSCAAGAAAGDLRVHESDRQVAVGPGMTLEVSDIAGSIALMQAGGATSAIHARASAQTSDPASVHVEVQRKGDRVLVCVVYPGDACEGQHHHDGDDRNDTRVDLSITVPRGAHVTAGTVDGDVTATHLENDLDANVVDGSVRVSASGRIHAKTVNGAIEANLGSGSEPDEFKAVNGEIHLIYPRGANASVSARTLSGDLVGDGVTFSQSNDTVGHRGTATLGKGGAVSTAQTVAGSIRVSRR